MNVRKGFIQNLLRRFTKFAQHNRNTAQSFCNRLQSICLQLTYNQQRKQEVKFYRIAYTESAWDNSKSPAAFAIGLLVT